MENKENLKNMYIKDIAISLIVTIEKLKLQDRCSNYNDTWENTKELFLEEAEKGESNPIFWEAVENMAKTIKEFTR